VCLGSTERLTKKNSPQEGLISADQKGGSEAGNLLKKLIKHRCSTPDLTNFKKIIAEHFVFTESLARTMPALDGQAETKCIPGCADLTENRFS
jgi:hypothetical protein